jgi:hypothetical protein
MDAAPDNGSEPGAGVPAGLDSQHALPILPAQWRRLRALDRYCTITLQRAEPYVVKWRALPKTWNILIRHRRSKMHDSIRVERPTLREAIEVAITEAERRCYHTPTPNDEGGPYGIQ